MKEQQRIKILLIEDNEDDIFFIKKALPENKYSLQIIKSGTRALKFLQKPDVRPDIVLLDKSLPEMNGLELLSALKSKKLEYSVIFLTIDSNVNTVIQAMKAGAMDFIVKSNHLKEELPEKIEKVYSSHLEKLEKKRIEEELRISEDRFQSMFINSPIAYQSLDENGVFVDVNEMFCSMLGYKRSELIGKSFVDFWFYKDEKSFLNEFEKFKRKEHINVELALAHKDGHKIYVVLDGRSQRDSKGNFVKTHCIFHNITERKLMEDSLAHQFDFQRLVAFVASTFISQGNVTWSEKFDIVLRKIGEFYKVDRCYIFRFKIQNKTDVWFDNEWCNGTTQPMNHRFWSLPWEKYSWFCENIRHKKPFWCNDISKMEPIAYEEMQECIFRGVKSFICTPMIRSNLSFGVFGLDVVNSNKTWTKKESVELGVIEAILVGAIMQVDTENARIESELRYKTVADYTFNWEYWVLPDKTITYMSPAVENITGYKAKEFVDDPNLIEKIIFIDDLPRWFEHIDKAGKSFFLDAVFGEIEIRIVSKEGEIKWIKHFCRKIFTNEGDYLGLRVSNQDITNKVEMEKRLLNIATEVEEREKNRFSKELHDGLGPLLSSVKLYFQWLAETDDAEKIKLISEKGNNNIDLAIQTTREISHNLSPRFLVKYGFVEALKNFVNNINEVSKIKIDFTYNTKTRVEEIKEKVLYAIACELINNTIKHAEATSATIEYNFDSEKGIVFLYSDNGKGFDIESLEDSNNNGLGINNIHQKVSTLRGQIKIESKPGKGMSANIVL
jgi:PAS domain S-box-containing protein